MKRQRFSEESNEGRIKFQTEEFQRCLPIFQRLGLKPRRYLCDGEAAYVGTIEGWFRLSFKKYNKQELKWLRRILEYLHERSFRNWAVSWQKTIIWEEHTFCYLIQPWTIAREHFQMDDPASVSRIAEITAELHSCGKDYFENRGIEILRDRWQTIDLEWENAFHTIDQFKIEFEHEKTRKELEELRKSAGVALSESLSSWRKSGLSSLMEHHQRSGVLGHGNLLVKNIIWGGNDYYLLNWEGLAFQPRIVDLASLINDVGMWEADWILFLLNEYAKIQPLWPEEHEALFALLRYPRKIVELFNQEMSEESLDRKNLKEVARELTRKERCLGKAWKELGTQKRWVWGRQSEMPSVNQGKISMVLSPVESWGDFAGQADSLIHVKHDQKLPNDVMERLTSDDADRLVAGRDGNILDSAAKEQPGYNENNFIEIVEPQPTMPSESDPDSLEDVKSSTADAQMEPVKNDSKATPRVSVAPTEEAAVKVETPMVKEVEGRIPAAKNKVQEKAPLPLPQIVQWSKFPKPLGANKKLGPQ